VSLHSPDSAWDLQLHQEARSGAARRIPGICTPVIRMGMRRTPDADGACAPPAGLLPELEALAEACAAGGEQWQPQEVAARERALRILSRVAARCGFP